MRWIRGGFGALCGDQEVATVVVLVLGSRRRFGLNGERAYRGKSASQGGTNRVARRWRTSIVYPIWRLCTVAKRGDIVYSIVAERERCGHHLPKRRRRTRAPTERGDGQDAKQHEGNAKVSTRSADSVTGGVQLPLNAVPPFLSHVSICNNAWRFAPIMSDTVRHRIAAGRISRSRHPRAAAVHLVLFFLFSLAPWPRSRVGDEQCLCRTKK